MDKQTVELTHLATFNLQQPFCDMGGEQTNVLRNFNNRITISHILRVICNFPFKLETTKEQYNR